MEQLTYNQYKDMVLRIMQFENANQRKPNYVTVNNTKITKVQYTDMINRVNAFIKQYGRNPKYVTISSNANTNQKPTFTSWYNSMIGIGYKEYFGDKFTPAEEDANIKNHISMNCSDYSQKAYRKAKELDYEVRYIHVKCQSGTGHIYIQVKGREFKDWTNADLAAAASIGSKYPIGKVWCSNPKTLIISNEAWLINNDGR